MSVFEIIDTALLVLALVYIVALLRSHADILRRLAALEDGGGGGAPRSASPVGGGEVTAAGPIQGTTLTGDSVTLSFDAGSPVTLLAFLSSGCSSCAPLWAGLREVDGAAALADRVLVVTHDRTRESPARVGRLAPAGAEVIMSTAAWEDYAVPASPHFVLTDGAGGILGRGSALSWSQLVAMVDEARADAEAAAGRPARTTAERALRSEQTLAQAGIGPGHPSLYPSAGNGRSHEAP